ncbi:MAG: hypothetical protein ACOX6F_05985 [Syntrophomonadaceae bacterium]|jgi:hypothetical protein|nr:hypothetical protein [Bacillota bacterium]NLM89118.1 DUF3232 domain-containing protein [Syntrophomonadaceae bacterium]HAA09522.1 hypothetical protein [Syntrophomonas sp.]HQD90768.1 hypothetical protein [Syntrophomonadaceae bacterium]
MSIKQRVESLIEAIESDKSEEKIKVRKKLMIKNLLESSLKYVHIVVIQGVEMQLDDGAGNRQRLQELASIDENRSRTHDSLISVLNAVNRMCAQYELAPIYQGKDNRRDIGDFALEIMEEYFRERL